MSYQKLIAICLSLICTLNLHAQNAFTVTPNLHEENIVDVDPASIYEHRFESIMANNTNETLPIQWKVVWIDKPEAWHVVVSDINQSLFLSPSFLDNGAAMQLDLLPNVDNAIYNLHFHPEQTSGCGEVWMEMSNSETQVVYDTVRYDLLLNNCDNTVSTDELSNDDFTIFPNPVSQFLTIDGIDSPTVVTFFNSVGKMVYREKILSTEQVNVAALPGGVYFLSLNDRNGARGILKFIKL